MAIARKDLPLLLMGVATGAIAGACSGFGVPFFVDRVFRKVFEEAGSEPGFWMLAGIAALLPLIFILRGLSLYANQYLLQQVSQNILGEIRSALFQKTQELPVSWFEARQSGDLMAKMVGDTTQIQNATLALSRDLLIQPFTFLAGLGFLTYLSIQQSEITFLLLVVILTPLLIGMVRIIGRKLRKRSRELQETLGRLTEIMTENLRGLTEVRAFNLQERERTRFTHQLNLYTRFAMKLAKYERMTQPMMEIIAVSMVSVAFLVSYYKSIDFSTFAAMGAALFFTIDAAKRLVRIFTVYQRSRGSFDRIDSILDETSHLPEPAQPVEPGSITGKFQFHNLRFSYEDTVALDIPELTIPAGETVALVGPSGAGKTTFARLLIRFYDPVEGDILLDGHPLRQLRQIDLRQHIAFVPQDPVLFNSTVRENIRIGDLTAADAAVEQAAEMAFARDFIDQLPNGFETEVGENAVRLSGGQRQRLALARAFLRNAPILILDEATSALDTESEQKIQMALRNYAEHRTVFIIAHRFATIRLAREILLFENGKIRARGSMDELMNDSLFRSLYELQH